MCFINFIIQNAWKYIIYHKYNSIIMIIAFALGFLFPLLAVNDINDLIRDGEVSRYKDASHIVVIEYLMQYKNKEEIDAAVDSCRKEGLFDSVGYFLSAGLTVCANNAFYSSGICAVSEGYLPLAGYELVDGTVFSEDDYAAEGERVCLLEYGGVLARSGIRVGDMVEIAGSVYKVKGVVRAPRTYGGILLPYAAVSTLQSELGGRIQYRILAYSETEVRPIQVAEKLFPFERGNIITTQTGVQEEKLYYDSIWTVNRYRIQRAVIVIAFAGINVLILLIGIIAKGKYDMALRTALGADRKILWAESLIRNLMLMQAAFLLALPFYLPVAALITNARSRLQVKTLLQVGITGVVFIILINSAAFFQSFRKQDVARLLKE